MIWHTGAKTIKGGTFSSTFLKICPSFVSVLLVAVFQIIIISRRFYLRIHKLWDLSFPFHRVDVFTRWIFSTVCFQMFQFTVWSVHRCDNTDASSFVTAIYWRKIQQHKCSLMRVFGFSSQNTRILLRVSKKHNIIEMENFKVFQHGKHYCKDI